MMDGNKVERTVHLCLSCSSTTSQEFLAFRNLRRQRAHIRAPSLPLHQNLAHHLARPRRITDPPTRMSTGDKHVLGARHGADERCAPAREGEEACLLGTDGSLGGFVEVRSKGPCLGVEG